MPTLKIDSYGDPYLLEDDGKTLYVYFSIRKKKFLCGEGCIRLMGTLPEYVLYAGMNTSGRWVEDDTWRGLGATYRDRIVWLQVLMEQMGDTG